jgi:hypothetical protein
MNKRRWFGYLEKLTKVMGVYKAERMGVGRRGRLRRNREHPDRWSVYEVQKIVFES